MGIGSGLRPRDCSQARAEPSRRVRVQKPLHLGTGRGSEKAMIQPALYSLGLLGFALNRKPTALHLQRQTLGSGSTELPA